MRVGAFRYLFIFLILGSMSSPSVRAQSDLVNSPEKLSWPYFPPLEVNPPEVKAKEQIRNDIDRFILRKLEAKGLGFAPLASKSELVRRLYLDLIGLPPQPEEVKSFLENKDPQAYEKLVDKLLQDPRYGERWARFWLDLARYADTAGYEGDPDLPHAWRYRNYVIDSFNKDKPYDRFIMEQIAGDEFSDVMGAGHLPGVSAENTVALTFLRLAPFTEPRGDETRHELLSEMTTTVSSVFLGLTVGCAKCHDHKYDKIPTKDFYRMKAFFSTVQIPRPLPGDIFQIGGPLPAGFYIKGEKDWINNKRGKLEAEIQSNAQAFQKIESQLRANAGNQGSGFGLQAISPESGNDYYYDRQIVHDGKLHWTVTASDSQRWLFYTDGKPASSTGTRAGQNKGVWFGDLKKIQHVSLGTYTNGTGKPEGYGHSGSIAEILVYDHPPNSKEIQKLNQYIQGKYSGSVKNLLPPKDGLSFWLDAADLDANPQTKNPAQGEKVALWKDKVLGVELTQSDPKLRPKLISIGKNKRASVEFNDSQLIAKITDAPFFKHQKGSIVTIFTARGKSQAYGFEVGGNQAFLSTFYDPEHLQKIDLNQIANSRGKEILGEEGLKKYRWLKRREPYIQQHLKRLQPVAMSLRHSYGPPYEPGVPTSRVMIRGEYDNPGEIVEAGFLSAITGHQKPAAIRLDPFKRWPTRSRRMALARWIASSKNPLTARVMVNRLWHWHFGRGIVATPSDFGVLGGGPSHSELLDWLARQFVANKWSVKKMHRLMVLSGTYRQSTRNQNSQALNIDPENTLLWKFRRRRLEAEAVRDSVLTASGRLNPEMYGLPIFPPLPDEIGDRVKYSKNKWATDLGPEGRRRSVYIYQQRTLSMPFLQAFDSVVCDDSRDRRATSVTPLQSLAMYNGEFVSGEAKYFAKRLLKEAPESVEAQIKRAFLIAFSRLPSPHEVQGLKTLVNDSKNPSDPSGIEALCRVLLNSNEFLYID